jgi:hypothetical protein
MANKKITKKELKELNDLITVIRNKQVTLGGLELQKHRILHDTAVAQKDLGDFQAKLQEKYGEVTIDTTTGEIKSN